MEVVSGRSMDKKVNDGNVNSNVTNSSDVTLKMQDWRDLVQLLGLDNSDPLIKHHPEELSEAEQSEAELEPSRVLRKSPVKRRKVV